MSTEGTRAAVEAEAEQIGTAEGGGWGGGHALGGGAGLGGALASDAPPVTLPHALAYAAAGLVACVALEYMVSVVLDEVGGLQTSQVFSSLTLPVHKNTNTDAAACGGVVGSGAAGGGGVTL